VSFLFLRFDGDLLAQLPPGSLEGQVTDPSGAAISGASDLVTAADGTTRVSATDARGQYQIEGLAPGS